MSDSEGSLLLKFECHSFRATWRFYDRFSLEELHRIEQAEDSRILSLFSSRMS